MASTVFQLSVTLFAVTLTVAFAPTSADEIPCNAVTTCRLGREKFIVKTTVTPSQYYDSQNATYSTYGMQVRNHIAVKRRHDGTETMTSESTTNAAYCTVKEDADIELGALLDAGEGAMVTLIAGDTRLTAHSAVLAARSPGFAHLLCHGTQDVSSSEVAITDVEGPVLRQLVAYLYTQQVPQLPAMAPQLLAAADKFGLSSLKAECEVQVASQLSVDTAAETAVLAIKHSSTTLRQTAIAFIRAHLIHVMATQGWADAVRRHPEEMVEIYRLLATQPVQSRPHNVSLSSTPATAVNHTTTNGPSLPKSSQEWTPVASAPVSQPTTKAPSPPHTSHGQTPVAAASPSPPTSSPDYSAVCPLWSLSSEEKGRRLIKASKEGSVEEVEALLAVGADVGARGKNRWTALHSAAAGGHLEVARRLLQAGAEVDARDIWQKTPLFDAAWNGHTAVVRLLLDSSADPNARAVYRDTALHKAAQYDHPETAAALLEAGADRGIRDMDGRTPLDVARERKHQRLIQLLT